MNASISLFKSHMTRSIQQRSTQGCMHEGNDPLVEDLLALKHRVRESSHLVSNYGRAIASVRAHPTPLRSASEAKQLKNIGNYLANKIHSILLKRRLLPPEQAITSKDEQPLAVVAPVEVEHLTRRDALGTPERPVRDYVPAYRKQPWYVLQALQEAHALDGDAAVSSNSLLQRMQRAGYDGNRGKLRTCLASLSGAHEVVKRSNTGYYYLTDKGQRSAVLCPGSLTRSGPNAASFATVSGISRQCPSSPEAKGPDDELVREEVPEPEPEMTSRSCAAMVDLIRETDSWELVLLLDHREIVERRTPRTLERKLLEQHVHCEVRALAVGDVQWIARRHRVGGDVEEFVMNVIVERKEVHDLSSSIIDRRFFEQKTRLATVRENCGDVHVIYLIEGSLAQITSIRTSGLNTAMGRIQVQNNFFVQQCQNADETVTFLARVYARLLAKFPPNSMSATTASSHLLAKDKRNTDDFAQIFCQPPQTFAPFNSQFRKKTQFTVGEIYQQMLLQVPGLSAAKTVGLSSKYQTFHELDRAVRKRGRENEIDHVPYGKNRRRLGIKTREFLCELLTCRGYTDET